MSDTYDAAIESIQREIIERMRAANSLCLVSGRALLYPDPDGQPAPGGKKIRSDRWYTAGLSTAAREFLAERRDEGPASVDQIYAALVSGGFKFDAKDEATSKPALKQSLTKNTAIFHRLPNGNYGLAEWYPGRKGETEKPSLSVSKKRKDKHAKPNRAEEKRPTGPSSESGNKRIGTLMDSVRSAIKAAPGDFTKQDILDWILQKNPELNAQRMSVFTMVTHLREEMGLTIVKESRGRELGIYRRSLAAGNGANVK